LFSSVAPDELPFAEDCSFGSAAPGMIDAAAEAIALAARLTTPGFLGAALRFAVFFPVCFLATVFFAAVFFAAVFLAGRRAAVFFVAVLGDFLAALRAVFADFLLAFLAIHFLHWFCLNANERKIPLQKLHRIFTRDSLPRFAFR